MKSRERKVYISRTVPGWASVRGLAATNAYISVNGNEAFTVAGRVVPDAPKYYFGSDDFDNSAQSGWAELETYATVNGPTNDLVSAVTNRVFVPQTPETFAYDADGNLTEDGRFRYYWNGENRLVRAEEKIPPEGRDAHVIVYSYDHQGRNVVKDGSLQIWDAYNIVVEDAAASNATVNLWGLDIDGTMQGAGGVGGLLAVARNDGMSLPLYDANGNVTEYISGDGVIISHGDYSSFGRERLIVGDNSHSHGFSTKPWCRKSGLVEYQMRKYMPWQGGWMSRDPYYGALVLKLYSYCNNWPIQRIDMYGLDIWSFFGLSSTDDSYQVGDRFYGNYGGAKRVNGKDLPPDGPNTPKAERGQGSIKRDQIGGKGNPDPVDGFDRCYLEHDRCIADANDCSVTPEGYGDEDKFICDVKLSVCLVSCLVWPLSGHVEDIKKTLTEGLGKAIAAIPVMPIFAHPLGWLPIGGGPTEPVPYRNQPMPAIIKISF